MKLVVCDITINIVNIVNNIYAEIVDTNNNNSNTHQNVINTNIQLAQSQRQIRTSFQISTQPYRPQTHTNNNSNSNNLFSINNVNSNNNDFIMLAEDSTTLAQAISSFETSLEEIYANISLIITTEKEKIQKEKDNIQKAKKEFNDYKTQELTKIEKEKLLIKDKFKLAQGCSESDIIDIDVGGTHFPSTTRSTLIKYKNSALAQLFSGNYTLTQKGGKVFIDREGEPFVNVINYLRSGTFPILRNEEEETKFYDELDFWKIPIYEGSKYLLHTLTNHITPIIIILLL
jgi:hypothetical protein